MKKIALILPLLLAISPAYSQNKLTDFTYEVVDTTKTQTDQAKDIYAWLTDNIAYDTKQVEKGLKSYTPLQTLNRKKAVCYGYAELFHAMCEVLDIESYIIYGYSKGFGYEKGDHFTKSNHSWNIIYADSSWIIIDATWGSGSLSYEYDLKNKIKRIVNKNAGIKSLANFSKDTTSKYFDISPGEIIKTHFPIDAKWQLIDYPLSYNEFITDSVGKTQFLNYTHEISFVRYREVPYQLFMDALNSTRYNPYNKFDIAYQYYKQASQLKITRKTLLDSTLLKSLNSSLNYYDSSLSYLNQCKIIRRSFYKTKNQNRKAAYKLAGSTIKKTDKIPSTNNDRYFNEYNKFLKKETILKKLQLSSYVSAVNLPSGVYFGSDTVSSYDTSLCTEYLTKIKADTLVVNDNLGQLAQLKEGIKYTLKNGQEINDSILRFLIAISNTIQSINFNIERMDEYEVYMACNKLSNYYQEYGSAMESKNQLENIINEAFNDFQDKSVSIERTLFSIIDYYEKLAELTGDSASYSNKTMKAYTILRKIYAENSETISFLKQHNDQSEALLSNQDEILSIYGENGLSTSNDKLTEFYNFISMKNEKAYKNDLKLYNSIRSDARKNITLIKNTIREINKTLAN